MLVKVDLQSPHTFMRSVAILLCTYNGAQFLPAQLASLADQSFRIGDCLSPTTAPATRLWRSCRNTGVGSAPRRSTSATDHARARQELPQPRLRSFAVVRLLCLLRPGRCLGADKLARAVERLSSAPAHIPAMYCSRTMLIDDEGGTLGYSRAYRRKPSFHNALVQSIASGNTIVFNEAARRLLMICGSAAKIPSHDWWTYLLTSGAGGVVYYDQMPQVRYACMTKTSSAAIQGCATASAGSACSRAAASSAGATCMWRRSSHSGRT